MFVFADPAADHHADCQADPAKEDLPALRRVTHLVGCDIVENRYEHRLAEPHQGRAPRGAEDCDKKYFHGVGPGTAFAVTLTTVGVVEAGTVTGAVTTVGLLDAGITMTEGGTAAVTP